MIPDELRDRLPRELKDAEIVGADIAAPDENVRLHGPPGTGKSTQTALRTATRAINEGLRPSDMTIVTYRKSLAGVVRDRLLAWDVWDSPDRDEFDFWTTTHAAAQRATDFFDRVDEDEPEMVTVNDEYEFCSEMGVRRDTNHPAKQSPWEVFKSLYDYSKSSLLDLGEYRFLSTSRQQNLLRSFENNYRAERLRQQFAEKWERPIEEVTAAWEGFKAESGLYDFYEQLEAALSAPNPPTRHVAIDEYHDATPLMSAVAEQWIEAADTAIVAGDPNQVVNAYAGADPRFFENLPTRVDVDIPKVLLDTSYRVPAEHLAAANEMLSEEITPPPVTPAGRGEIVEFHAGTWDYDNDNDRWGVLPRPLDEPPSPAWIVDTYDDVMFLARTRFQLDGVATALDRMGAMHRSQDGVGRGWEYLTTIMQVLALLDGAAPDDAKTLTPPQVRVLLDHVAQADLSERLDRVKSVLLDEDHPVRLGELASYTKSSFWDHYTNGQQSLHNLVKRDRLSTTDLKAMSRAWQQSDPPFSLDGAPKVLTIHASKGMEAKNVVLYDGVANRTKAEVHKSDKIAANEARTWYVALTRASDRLLIGRGGWSFDNHLPEHIAPNAVDEVEKYGGGGRYA